MPSEAIAGLNRDGPAPAVYSNQESGLYPLPGNIIELSQMAWVWVSWHRWYELWQAGSTPSWAEWENWLEGVGVTWDLSPPFTGCRTLEEQAYTSPGQHNRANPGEGVR